MFPQRLAEGFRAILDERLPREKNGFEALADRGQSPEAILDASPCASLGVLLCGANVELVRLAELTA